MIVSIRLWSAERTMTCQSRQGPKRGSRTPTRRRDRLTGMSAIAAERRAAIGAHWADQARPQRPWHVTFRDQAGGPPGTVLGVPPLKSSSETCHPASWKCSRARCSSTAAMMRFHVPWRRMLRGDGDIRARCPQAPGDGSLRGPMPVPPGHGHDVVGVGFVDQFGDHCAEGGELLT